MTILSAKKHQTTWQNPTIRGAYVLFKSRQLAATAARASARLAAATALCLMAGQAAKADNARINSFSLDAQVAFQHDQVNVTSSSGDRWDTIDPTTIKFHLSGRLDTKWPGEVVEAGVFLGNCANGQCANYPILQPSRNFADTRDWNINQHVSFSTSRIPTGSPNAVMLSDFGQKALAACNAGAGDGPRVAKSFYHPMTVSLSVNTQKNLTTTPFAGSGDEEFSGGDTTQRATFPIKVNCIPYPSMVVGADPVEVFAEVQKPSANTCPANGKLRTRIVYHYPKTAKFDIKRNGKVIKTVEIKARKQALSHGPDQWVIDRIDEVRVEGGENKFRVKIRDGGKSKAIKFNHNCPQFEVLFSNLEYNMANDNKCPKKVWETATFITNGPGEATVQLVQEGGHVFFEKKLDTIFKNGQYKLVNQRVLDIPMAFERKFKAQIKGMSGIHSGWKTLKVECPAKVGKVGEGAPSGLTVGPKPSHAAEETPKVLVAPLPNPRKPVVVVTPAPEKPRIKTAPLPPKRDNAAARAAARAAEQAKAERAKVERAAKRAEVRKKAKRAEARKAAKRAEAQKAAKRAEAQKAAKRAEARKKAKRAEARKAAKRAEAQKAAKRAEARNKAKRAEARKAAKRAEARKAAKRAEARKKAKRANVAKRANGKKCRKGRELVRGRCIKRAG